MKYGYFDNENKEYVITKPETPYPWINYLGNTDFLSLISNTGAGYCFYKDARLRRILRYRYNNIPADSTGRYFYIKDGETVFNIGKYPAKTELDHYSCRHGLGYTKIKAEKNGISACDLAYVPLDVNGEVHHITLSNRTDRQKRIQVFSYMEFCLWDAWDDQTNFQRNYNTGEVYIKDAFICHITEYRERRNHFSFLWCSAPVSGFDTDRESFLGLYNGLDRPEVVFSGKSKNSVAHGWSPIASHSVAVDLAPGETKTITWVLGYVENNQDQKYMPDGLPNIEQAESMVKRYQNSESVSMDMTALKAYWEELLSHYQIESEDERLNTMVNIWNQYQCMVTFNLSRSASFFESGVGRGMGFRDSNQDILGFVHQIPDLARERLIDIAATQFTDGSTYHQYQPLTKKGNADIGSGFNDDPLWLVLAVVAYIKETGDEGILDVAVPFNDMTPAKMIDHLEASVGHVINNLGPHGLPLIGRADWNDCLNLNCHSVNPGESFQTFGDPYGDTAESVMIAGLFVYAGTMYAELLGRVKENEKAEQLTAEIKRVKQAVDDHGWDGDWFKRAYDAEGRVIGSKECDEGRIYIEPQGLCVMAGIGRDDGRAIKALDSVGEHLKTEYGIMLQQPAYTAYRPELGEISSYPPGYKENAGIFCHNNAWIVCAEAEMGRGEKAFEAYAAIAPAYQSDDQRKHRTEPYVYAQMVAGRDAADFGEAKNSWLTGTASWCFVSIAQFILGIKPDFEGLRIDPCLPPDLKTYTITRKFRGAIYIIKVSKASKNAKGVRRMIVDGKAIADNLVPLSENAVCRVEVEI